jgi:hypothetical protein
MVWTLGIELILNIWISQYSLDSLYGRREKHRQALKNDKSHLGHLTSVSSREMKLTVCINKRAAYRFWQDFSICSPPKLRRNVRITKVFLFGEELKPSESDRLSTILSWDMILGLTWMHRNLSASHVMHKDDDSFNSSTWIISSGQNMEVDF